MKAKPTSGSSKKAKTPVSQESFGLPGKTYKTPANAVKTTSLPKDNKTKRLAGMQGSSNFKNKSLGEVVSAALAVTSVAGLAKTVAARQLTQSIGKQIIGKATVPRQAGRDAYKQLVEKRGGSQFVPKQVRKQEWLKFSPAARNSASKIPKTSNSANPEWWSQFHPQK